MEIHKNEFDLINYGIEIDTLVILPIEINADDEKCEVIFDIVNKRDRRRKVKRSGKHDNFVFTTSYCNTPFKIDLRTGVIRKVRK